MSTETMTPEPSTPGLVQYHVTVADIKQAGEQYATLAADTPQGYELVRTAIGHMRSTRVEIENRRVELKAEALEYGRRVDSVAKELTGLVLEIEEPLKAKKAVIDEAKERARQEKALAAQRALEEKVRAERAVEEARLREERAAEEAKLAEERAKIEAERKAFSESQKVEAEKARLAAEALRAERAAIDAERRKIEAERQAAQQAELVRLARIEAEQQAAARAEQVRIAAENAKIAAAEHAARLEALKPDAEKLRSFAAVLRLLEFPTVSTQEAMSALEIALSFIEQAIEALENVSSPFGSK